MERLDALMLTHAEADHEGAALAVITHYRPTLIVDGGAGWSSAVQRMLPASSARVRARRITTGGGPDDHRRPAALRGAVAAATSDRPREPERLRAGLESRSRGVLDAVLRRRGEQRDPGAGARAGRRAQGRPHGSADPACRPCWNGSSRGWRRSRWGAEHVWPSDAVDARRAGGERCPGWSARTGTGRSGSARPVIGWGPSSDRSAAGHSRVGGGGAGKSPNVLGGHTDRVAVRSRNRHPSASCGDTVAAVLSDSLAERTPEP